MNKFGKLAVLAACVTPGLAMAQINIGHVLGSSEADIRSALEAQGYTISEVETEQDEIEIYAFLNGKKYEIEVSPETGAVIEIELADDEDDS
ncbi:MULTISPECIES: PepSY domain-containing protein [unclassified Ruegeria]|uniref:PepSY domain-containing protein n=1 Tax=unclassified Ruegeria TaxID=2625375 RepID=UPI0014899A63|nr:MULTISPECIES: PepSY domain-containing protein [unclassified Ruegeria]NOD34502.1 hypothetical protein [Ruegeria sp. HKCCD7296]NOE40274.1 hypothetical protein [Ruegeria sp. HKCCD7319]